MTPHQFLARVTPAGLRVIAEPGTQGFKQGVFETVEAAAQKAVEIDAKGRDCYFSLASLKEARVWNPHYKNAHGVAGKWEIRVGSNLAELKCFFLDVDIEPNNERKYASQQEALAALDEVCAVHGLLQPLVVSSGGGLHCYWIFTRSVTAEAWRPVAMAFKQALQKIGFKADPVRTADASSVLRVVGTHNHKQSVPRPVAVLRDPGDYSTTQVFDNFNLFVTVLGFSLIAPADAVITASPFDELPGNLDKTYEPVPFGPILRGCRQILRVAADGGMDGEPVWRSALSVTRCTTTADKASLFVSERYPNFDRADMDKKLAELAQRSVGPHSCASFDTTLPNVCPTCLHWGKVTNPIQLSKPAIVEADAPTIIFEDADTGEVEETILPKPPFPFLRRAEGGIVMKPAKGAPADAEGEESNTLVYQNDIYPIRRLVSERSEVEETVWRVHLPVVGQVDITVPQSTLAEPGRLHGLLLSKGVYVHPAKIKIMVIFMVAYITQLQKEFRTEQLFSRMGFREHNTLFVLGDKVYRKGAPPEHHQISTDVHSDLPGLQRAGTLDGWKEAIQFYNAPGHEAYRFMIYGAFGSVLFHMTGHKSMIVNASGRTGLGKTRTLNAINSVWGHPVDMGLNGNHMGMTQTARYAMLSVYNNLPFCFDEITRLPAEDLGDFTLMVSQGTGKRRSTRDGTLSKNIETWANIVYTSANTNAYVAIMQNRRDATAEAARILQIPFMLPSHYTQQQADTHFLDGLMKHHGHACHVFVPYLLDSYDKVRSTVADVAAQTVTRGKMRTAERFQSSAIAVHMVGALVARKIGLLDDFPIDHDWTWAIDQIPTVRASINEHHSSPRDLISEFMEQRVGETLTVSQTTQQNLAPRIDQQPRGALTIRLEADTQIAYISKEPLKRWCIQIGANYGEMQDALRADGSLLDHDARRVLGAGTDLSKAQTRCWMINIAALSA